MKDRKTKLAILNLYLFAIAEVKSSESMFHIESFLRENWVFYGMCSCVNNIRTYELEYVGKKWIKNYLSSNMAYWGKTPSDYMIGTRTNEDRKKGIIRALQLRVRNLKKELVYV